MTKTTRTGKENQLFEFETSQGETFYAWGSEAEMEHYVTLKGDDVVSWWEVEDEAEIERADAVGAGLALEFAIYDLECEG